MNGCDGDERSNGVTRVMVVARMRLLREGLADAMRRGDAIDLVVAVSGPEDARREAEIHRPDVSVVDLHTLSDRDISRLGTAVGRVVVVGCPDRSDEVVGIVEAGASGFITVEQSVEDLWEAVRYAGRGEMACSPTVAAALARRVASLAGRGRRADGPVDVLTPRERDIAALLEQGLSNREIAARLYIELPTVKNHVQSILRKLDVRRRGEAAALLRTAR